MSSISADAPDHDISVSVIVPVYNAMPFLADLLTSLDDQTLDVSEFEVVFVDDGSTDSSPEVLDSYVAAHPNARVIHQENSGWAGKPRNVGMDHARGEYFFFVDADDRLGHEALQRLIDFAMEHNSDVVAPKIMGLDGRKGGGKVFSRTVVDAPLDLMIRTLMPQKLIRAQLLRENNIRFREDKVRLEDGMMLVQAYCASQRNSILADYDFYHLRARSDGGNISLAPLEPVGYTLSLKTIASTLSTEVDDPSESQALIAALFSRKALKIYRGQRFLKYTEAKQLAWIAAHRQYLVELLEDPAAHFAGIRRAKVEHILARDLHGLRHLAQQEIAEEQHPELLDIALKGAKAHLTIQIPDYFSSQQRLVGVERQGTKRWVFEAPDDKSAQPVISFIIPLRELCGRVDLSIELDDGRLKRLVFPDSLTEAAKSGIRIYRTVNGYASIDARKASKSFLAKLTKKLGKVGE